VLSTLGLHPKVTAPTYYPVRAGIVGVSVPIWGPTLGLAMNNTERKERIAYYIQDARIARGFEVKELADLVGVGKSSVYDWENGETLPSLANLGPLCDALGVDADLFAHPPEIPDSPVRRYMLAKDPLTPAEVGEIESALEDADRLLGDVPGPARRRSGASTRRRQAS
jgi:transcriptional regulator with XRE-family HTH domain